MYILVIGSGQMNESASVSTSATQDFRLFRIFRNVALMNDHKTCWPNLTGTLATDI